MSWVKEEIYPGDLIKHLNNNEIARDVCIAIRDFQEYVFISLLNILFCSKALAFTIRHKHALAEDEFIENEMEVIKADIEQFKVNHRDVYTTAISGIDIKYELSFVEAFMILTQPNNIKVKGTHFDILINLKYLKWLNWFKTDRSNPTIEPEFTFHISNARLDEILNTHLEGWKATAKEDDNAFNSKEGCEYVKMITSMTQSQIQPQIDKAYLNATNAVDIEGGNSQNDKKLRSYKWLNNPDEELKELYQLLLAEDNKLIHPDTTLEQFKAVFEAKPLKEIESVKWHDDNASELLYFIQQLEGTDGSIIEKGERANYQRLRVCFVKPDGKPFTENFRQAKQNLKNYGLSTVRQQKIDNIIKQFY